MELIHKQDRPRFRAQDMAMVRDLASPGNSAVKNLSLAEVVIQPGASVLEHYHRESEELFHILDGEGRMSVGDETCRVGQGDTVVVSSGTKHAVQNVGDRDLVMLVACAPAYRDDDQFLIELA